ELTHQLSPADEPDVPAGGCCRHLLVHRADVTLDEPDIGAGHSRKGSRREYPGRLLVRPRLSGSFGGIDRVPQHPLVGSRPHRERPDLLDERGITRRADIAEREQPVERIVDRGDEAIETGCRVVLGSHSTPAKIPSKPRTLARRALSRPATAREAVYARCHLRSAHSRHTLRCTVDRPALTVTSSPE